MKLQIYRVELFIGGLSARLDPSNKKNRQACTIFSKKFKIWTGNTTPLR